MKHVTMNLLNYFWKKGIKPIIANVEKKIDSTGDASNATVSFVQAQNQTNINSGDSLNTLFGKIMKTFADLKLVAFSGSYADLSNKPTIPTVPASLKNPQALTFTGGVTGSYDGSAAKTVKIPSGTNSLLATVAGTWLDAVQGKILKGLYDQHETKITQINSDLSYKWVVLTLKYGTTQAWNKLLIRKFGNICILVGVLVVPAGVVAWERHQIFTFPDGYIPAANINCILMSSNNNVCRFMTDARKAEIVFPENQTAEQDIWFNVAYIVM